MAQNVVVTIEPATVLVSQFMLHRYAEDFLSAAKASPKMQRYSPVRSYLACHAIEVVLKGFCRAKGEELDTLRRELGHDLEKCIAKARLHGLDEIVPLSQDELSLLAAANEFYCKKGFEYITGPILMQLLKGCKGLPDDTDLIALSERLVEGLRDSCKLADL